MNLFRTAVLMLSRLAAIGSCFFLVSMVGLILYEIVLRAFFDTSTFILDEVVGYAVAACTFFALGYSLEKGSIIRVNLLIGASAGRVRRGLEALAALAALLVAGILIWFFWLRAFRSWSRGTVSSSIAEVPMWIPEGLLLFGLIVFWLQALSHLTLQLFPQDRLT